MDYYFFTAKSYLLGLPLSPTSYKYNSKAIIKYHLNNLEQAIFIEDIDYVRINKTFLQHLLGLGDIICVTNDNVSFVFKNIKHCDGVARYLSQLV